MNRLITNTTGLQKDLSTHEQTKPILTSDPELIISILKDKMIAHILESCKAL